MQDAENDHSLKVIPMCTTGSVPSEHALFFFSFSCITFLKNEKQRGIEAEPCVVVSKR